MTDRHVPVTPTDVRAAKAYVELATDRGKKIPQAIQAIADAKRYTLVQVKAAKALIELRERHPSNDRGGEITEALIAIANATPDQIYTPDPPATPESWAAKEFLRFFGSVPLLESDTPALEEFFRVHLEKAYHRGVTEGKRQERYYGGFY